MSNTLEFLRFPPLGLVDKFRLAATILVASRSRDWKRLEKIPVADWLRRWSGRQTFDKIWRPLLESKLGDAYTRASAAFIWATIRRMYAARRSGLKKEMFGYVPGGYARILEVFGRQLAETGVEVLLRTRVAKISPNAGEHVKVSTEEDDLEFDRVVLTVPPPLAARLVTGLPDRERASLEDVEYQGIICASLLLKRPLGGYYVTNITDPGFPFTAVIEMTALVDRAHFGGRSLVYLPKYLAADSPELEAPDAEWQERLVAGLHRMYPSLADDDVVAFQVSRQRYVFALPTVGYSEQLPPRRCSVPGLYFVNSAQIVNGTLNVNETIRLAEEALPDLLCEPSTQAGRASKRPG
jgi:protoporphyrinogen oxidase